MTLSLNRTENEIDRIQRQRINENWTKIENNFNNVVQVISEKAFDEVVDAAKLIWQEPVDTFADLVTTYPNAEVGWAAWAREVVGGVAKAYRFNGTSWVLQQEFYGDAINEVDNRLTNEIEKNIMSINDISINVKDFGALGDGVNDDATAIRAAYDHLKTLGGGTLYFPKPTNYYSLKSIDSSYTQQNVAILLNSGNICFKAADETVSVTADINMDSIFYAPIRVDNVSFETIRINANQKAQHCFDNNNVYIPYLNLKNSRFYNALDIAFNVATFVTIFEKCIFANSRVGVKVYGIDGNIATACTFNSCYALNNREIGFETLNLVYSSLNSCAVDNMPNGIAYLINGRGVSLNSCGAENVLKPFKSTSFRGVSINTFFAGTVGSSDAGNPVDSLFEFVTGIDAVLNGIYIQQNQTRYYTKKLALTGNSYGSENITILDDSIRRDDASFVTNYKFQHPIKFLRGDETTRDETVTLNVDDLPDYLAKISQMEINYTLTIQLNAGTQTTLASKVNRLDKLSGQGKIILQGVSGNNSAVVLHGAYNRFYVEGCTCRVEIKDLTINNRSANVNSHIAQINNSNFVTFNNVIFNSTGILTGAAVVATNNSSVYLINQTMAIGGNFSESSKKTYDADSTSNFFLDAGDIPSAGRWVNGMSRKLLNPVAGGYRQVICVTSGTPGVWKRTEQIEA